MNIESFFLMLIVLTFAQFIYTSIQLLISLGIKLSIWIHNKRLKLSSQESFFKTNILYLLIMKIYLNLLMSIITSLIFSTRSLDDSFKLSSSPASFLGGISIFIGLIIIPFLINFSRIPLLPFNNLKSYIICLIIECFSMYLIFEIYNHYWKFQ